MSGRKKTFLAVSLIYIAFIVFPIFTSIAGNSIAIISAVVSVILIALYPKALLNKTSLWVFIYFFVFCSFILFGRRLMINMGSVSGIKQAYVEMGFILPSYIIMSILNFLNDKRISRIIVYASVLMFVISFIYLIPLLNEYRTILRGQDRRDVGEIFGLPSYNLMHAYVYLIPALLYAFKKNKGKIKWTMLAIIVLTLYIINATYTTTVLVLAIVCIIGAIIYRSKNGMLSILSLLIFSVIVFYIVQLGVLDSVLQSTSEAYQGTAVSAKISDFRNSLEEGELGGGTVEGRGNAHQISWDNFYMNPLWGGGRSGDHSVLLDRLGTGGLLLFVPFFMTLIMIARNQLKKTRTPQAKYFYYMGIMCAFVIMYAKGLFAAEGWLFYCVLFPQMIFVFEDSGNNLMTRKRKASIRSRKKLNNIKQQKI